MATTATPGSAAATAPEGELVARFGRTERTLHWVHALSFFGLTASGLILYLPGLSALVPDRPLVKAIHLAVAALWLTALAAIAVAGDRRQLRATRRELERFTDDDLRWLRAGKVPSGRFNAGQKVHATLQAAFAVLFTVSGVLLWLGERNTTFRLSGSLAVHDVTMFVALAMVAGHLFLALVWPSTRPALRGIVQGSVSARWARIHHAAWRALPVGAESAGGKRPSAAALAVLAVVLFVGVGGTVLLVWDVLGG